MQCFNAFSRLQVECHRLLAAVEDLEGERVAVTKGFAHQARVVAHLGALDLDDLRPQVAEDCACERAGQHLTDFNHLESGEWGHVIAP